MGRKSTTEEFIKRATKVHNEKNDYPKSVYVDNKTKICIICPIHGEFYQRPDIHLGGSVCPHCSRESRLNTLDYYIQLSQEKHGDKYDFSNSVYSGCNKEIEVRCKECGNIFYTTPLALIKGVGCKMCSIEADRKILCFEGEIWRDIKGFCGYQVSNIERVKSIDRVITVGDYKRKVDGLILKLSNDKDGYKTVNFKIGNDGKSFTKRVHRLVAEAFIENPQNYNCIDHINGIRDDNRVENLRWCTAKMNANYELALSNRSKAIKNSYISNPNLRKVRANVFRKTKSIKVEVLKDNVSLGIFDSQLDATVFLGVSQLFFSTCMYGRRSKSDIILKKALIWQD